MKKIEYAKFVDCNTEFDFPYEFFREWYWAEEGDIPFLVKYVGDEEETLLSFEVQKLDLADTQYADGYVTTKTIIKIKEKNVDNYFYCYERSYNSWADDEDPNFYPVKAKFLENLILFFIEDKLIGVIYERS